VRALRRTFRREATPSIRNRIEERLPELHEDAADLVNDKLALLEIDAPRVDAARRWSLAELLGEEDDPIA
jgi:ATP-dependent exoDNAse (exonuclease V) beta subunit